MLLVIYVSACFYFIGGPPMRVHELLKPVADQLHKLTSSMYTGMGIRTDGLSPPVLDPPQGASVRATFRSVHAALRTDVRTILLYHPVMTPYNSSSRLLAAPGPRGPLNYRGGPLVRTTDGLKSVRTTPPFQRARTVRPSVR